FVGGPSRSVEPGEFSALATPCLDLLSLAAASVRPAVGSLSRSRISLLNRAKAFIERHLSDPGLNAGAIAAGVGVSPRYLNTLFQAEQTSLMRYVWQRRVERCRTDMLAGTHAGRSLSEIAFRWGFNDPSHFSRLFRRRFGCTPRECRDGNGAELGGD
ncbi:helix-turn-helix domain-containing protein, partial [Methylogaea oryzae]|uniref:helix-turn-helix domain-containing protein n=1 Tax=Methylogaea oryzae TaxID=1295382 RepID=UPI000AE389D9